MGTSASRIDARQAASSARQGVVASMACHASSRSPASSSRASMAHVRRHRVGPDASGVRVTRARVMMAQSVRRVRGSSAAKSPLASSARSVVDASSIAHARRGSPASRGSARSSIVLQASSAAPARAASPVTRTSNVPSSKNSARQQVHARLGTSVANAPTRSSHVLGPSSVSKGAARSSVVRQGSKGARA